jgi:hypothetical protein
MTFWLYWFRESWLCILVLTLMLVPAIGISWLLFAFRKRGRK